MLLLQLVDIISKQSCTGMALYDLVTSLNLIMDTATYDVTILSATRKKL